jgi:molybdenum cofactor cytidylyltransferase/nicotine blue oxidoreductase
MGEPKADLVVDGERLIDRAIRVLRDGGCEPIVAVVRLGQTVSGATAVINHEPERGMRSSLELGIAGAGNADAIAVHLVDMPGIGGDAVRTVLKAWRPGRITIGKSAGRRVHPTVMAPSLWQEALGLAENDEGARRYLAAHPDLVDEIEIVGSAQDLDTLDDLAAYRHSATEL